MRSGFKLDQNGDINMGHEEINLKFYQCQISSAGSSPNQYPLMLVAELYLYLYSVHGTYTPVK